MKHNEDKHWHHMEFNEGDEVFLKLQPYCQKSLAHQYNEKLAPLFYGPYKISKKVGQAAYELALPPHSCIHPVFHVSQLKKATGTCTPSLVPLQLTDTLELHTTPAAVLNGCYRHDGALETLIQWSDLPVTEATWEEAALIAQQYPSFHLEDKVRLHAGGIAMPFSKERIWITY